ncbi:MAG: helix-turn-helix transcriptional regulator, partial [Spirochaetaceae bacterium]|nr:helix-turn-helix transcriptional regulator [Spirochaetaceae bacterium]
SNIEISEKCFISVGTVKNHLSHIYRKTNCSSRNKLIKLFIGHDYT